MWKEQKGLTLVELLAVLALSGVILGICGAVLVSLLRVSDNAAQHMEDNMQERYAIQVLSQHLTDTSNKTASFACSPTQIKLRTVQYGDVAFIYETNGGAGLLKKYIITNQQVASPTYAPNPVVLADNLLPNAAEIFGCTNSANGQVKISLPLQYTKYGAASEAIHSNDTIQTTINLNKY